MCVRLFMLLPVCLYYRACVPNLARISDAQYKLKRSDKDILADGHIPVKSRKVINIRVNEVREREKQ